MLFRSLRIKAFLFVIASYSLLCGMAAADPLRDAIDCYAGLSIYLSGMTDGHLQTLFDPTRDPADVNTYGTGVLYSGERALSIPVPQDSTVFLPGDGGYDLFQVSNNPANVRVCHYNLPAADSDGEIRPRLQRFDLTPAAPARSVYFGLSRYPTDGTLGHHGEFLISRGSRSPDRSITDEWYSPLGSCQGSAGALGRLRSALIRQINGAIPEFQEVDRASHALGEGHRQRFLTLLREGLSNCHVQNTEVQAAIAHVTEHFQFAAPAHAGAKGPLGAH